MSNQKIKQIAVGSETYDVEPANSVEFNAEDILTGSGGIAISDNVIGIGSAYKLPTSTEWTTVSDNASSGAAKVSCTDATVGGFGYTKVGVSASGSSSTEVSYITVNGTEYKLPSGGSGGGLVDSDYITNAEIDALFA